MGIVCRVRSATATAADLLSAINIWFQYGIYLDNAQFDVGQRVAQVLSSLPPGVQQPFVLKLDITNIPVAVVVRTGGVLDERQLFDRHLEDSNDRRKACSPRRRRWRRPSSSRPSPPSSSSSPMLSLTGVARNLFVPLALTIAFSLLLSLFVSRTVTPLMCLRMLKAGHSPRGFFGALSRFLDRLGDLCASTLEWVLRHRALTIASILGLFVASLLLVKKIATEFFPDSDEAQLVTVYKTPVGTRVEVTTEIATRLGGGQEGARQGLHRADHRQRPRGALQRRHRPARRHTPGESGAQDDARHH